VKVEDVYNPYLCPIYNTALAGSLSISSVHVELNIDGHGQAQNRQRTKSKQERGKHLSADAQSASNGDPGSAKLTQQMH
jgi:hypothetical protein